MRLRPAAVVLTLALAAHALLGGAAVALTALAQSFAAVVLVPVFLAALGITIVAVRALRPFSGAHVSGTGGDGPRPALGVAALAVVEGVSLATSAATGALQAIQHGEGAHSLAVLAHWAAYAASSALLLDAVVIALLAASLVGADEGRAAQERKGARAVVFVATAALVVVALEWSTRPLGPA